MCGGAAGSGGASASGAMAAVETVQLQIQDILKGNWWKKLKDGSLLNFAQKHFLTSKEQQNVRKLPSISSPSSSTSPQSSSSSSDGHTSSSSTLPESFDGMIVMAKRGDCLFEEKAINVQDRNGSAIIIQNREVFDFLPLIFHTTLNYCLLEYPFHHGREEGCGGTWSRDC